MDKRITTQKIAIGLVAVALFVGSMTAQADDFDVGMKAYTRGDTVTALPIFRHFAEQGNADVQNNLSFMYGKGLGICGRRFS